MSALPLIFTFKPRAAYRIISLAIICTGIFGLSGCGVGETSPQPSVENVKTGAGQSEMEHTARIYKETVSKETLSKETLAKTAQLSTDRMVDTAPPVVINCRGIAKPGGLLLCRTLANAKVKVSRGGDDFYYESADKDGYIFIGLDRDETYVELSATVGGETSNIVSYTLQPREYDISRIDGLPSNMVSTYSDEELARIRAATARKKVGFASRVQDIGLTHSFIMPLDGRKTTNFGAQRILNGEPKRPHYGVDIAAPTGTPIVAPADGIVSMADKDMYFEGSLLLIDHGQGLISYYLHMDDILVETGEKVTQGQQIATVGSRGRSTGPHLCWRLKWRNRNLDPELITQWPG